MTSNKNTNLLPRQKNIICILTTQEKGLVFWIVCVNCVQVLFERKLIANYIVDYRQLLYDYHYV